MFLRVSLGAVALWGHLLLPVASSCLPTAIPPAQRKNVTDSVGNSYPIGVIFGAWRSAEVASGIFEILIQEALGYNVMTYPQGVPGTMDAVYALLGCQDFKNIQDRGCADRKVRYHIFIESWVSLFAHNLQDLTKMYKAEVPRSGGSMGYVGVDGMYVPGPAKEAAQASTGLALEYFKSWNSSWYQPGPFFDNTSALNATEMLTPCIKTHFMDNSTVYHYYMLTGDADGVVMNGSTYAARCDDGYWWLAPACRTAPHSCVPYITVNSWNLQASMQKAAAFNMPLAQAVAISEDVWASIPRQFDALFYWWEPDDTFVALNPSQIIFPEFSRQARANFDYTGSSEEIDVVKLVSHDLGVLAPYVSDFLQTSLFELSNIRSFVVDQGPNVTRHDVACQWLQTRKDIWASWLPDRTVCVAGFGLYHDLRQEYVGDRQESQYLSCQPCPVGTFSEQFADEVGMTFRCADCPAGYRQPAAAASFCLPCAPGTFKRTRSREECTPCSFGTFQDQNGAQHCQSCANGTTTLGLGSYSPTACGCVRGTIEVERIGLNISCLPCETGLECPLLATLGGLQSGLSPTGEAPHLLPGFMSPDAEALSIFKCGSASHCPGGSPARCTGGRVADQVCATCPSGWRWAGSTCVPCETWLIVVWAIATLAIFILLPFAGYRRPEPAMSLLRDLQFTIQELIFLAIQSLQVFAIIRQITVEWPADRTDFVLSLMLLNIADLGVSCIVGSQPAEYVLQASFLPICSVWCCLCILVASRLYKFKSDNGSALERSVNTVGLIGFVFFETVCNTALAPFTCYAHPNGKHSVRQYSSVICESADHAIMTFMGGILMALLIGFLSASAWAVWRMPTWTVKKEMRGYVAAFRFVKEGYRLDSWWYGVPVLLTGPLLSLPGVLATDDPAAQVGLTTLILFAHLLLLLLCWPWKVPVVNVLETVSVSGALFQAISAGLFLPAGGGTSFSAIFSTLTRFVVFLGFASVVVTFIWGIIQCKCFGRTRRFIWMDLSRPRNSTELLDGLIAVMDSVAEMAEDHLDQKMKLMQPFDQNLLKSCIAMLSLEVLPAESFRNSLAMRATNRIRSSYRCSYSLDNLATRAYSMDAIQGVSDDEDEPAKGQKQQTETNEDETPGAASAREEATGSGDGSTESSTKTGKPKVCHVSFSPSAISTSTLDDEEDRPEVFGEAL